MMVVQEEDLTPLSAESGGRTERPINIGQSNDVFLFLSSLVVLLVGVLFNLCLLWKFAKHEGSQSQQMDRSRPTFHRKPLPSSCTPLNSVQGRQFFKEALLDGTAEAFFPLSEQFRTQDDPAFCGPSTLCMSLNALSIDPRRVWKGIWRWFDEDMVMNFCVDPEQAKKKGITLDQFLCMAKCNGAEAPLVGGATPGILRYDEINLETFRSVVKSVMNNGPWCKRINCTSSSGSSAFLNGGSSSGEGVGHNKYCSRDQTKNGVLVASYCRSSLGQTGSGHFSPLAAYHEASDQVLILDVARFKYPSHWVPLPLLHAALRVVDPATGQPRGIVLLAQSEALWDYCCCRSQKTCCKSGCSSSSAVGCCNSGLEEKAGAQTESRDIVEEKGDVSQQQGEPNTGLEEKAGAQTESREIVEEKGDVSQQQGEPKKKRSKFSGSTCEPNNLGVSCTSCCVDGHGDWCR